MRAQYDVVVMGGGPAGSTFAHLVRRQGFDVLLVEKGTHPRFSIGESLLPGTWEIWQELGLVDAFEERGFVRKHGAYFCFADGRRPHFVDFADARRVASKYAYEVPRAEFDAMLWEAARNAAVDCVDGTSVERVRFEGDRAIGVDLRRANGTTSSVDARLVADCTGRSTLIGRQCATRRRDPELNKVALYAHFDGVRHSTGRDSGTIGIISGSFGWAWIIPFGDGRTSVGITLDQSWYAARRKSGKDNENIWRDAVSRLPALSGRLTGAEQTRPVEAVADFQYEVSELAGDGWVAIGDAGAFVDPIFSSGVHLAMVGARRASRAATAALARDGLPQKSDFARYAAKTRESTDVFGKFIRAWYDPSFREIFIEPPDNRAIGWLRGEIASILAGAERPAWRTLPVLALMRGLARLNERAQRGEKTLLPKNERDRERRLRLSARRRAERRAARQA